MAARWTSGKHSPFCQCTCPWRIDKIMRPLESGTTLDNASATYTNRNPLGTQICG
jgi:hypothetical protein